MKLPSTIHEYVKQEENAYITPIVIADGYEWSMKEHLRETVIYKNGQLISGKRKGQLDERPVKNIIRPILNLQYRAEGFDVKDIELFINNSEKYYKSFLVRKFHEKWARQNNIDMFIDDLVETYVDFGGVLVKKTKSAVPEVVPFQSIAFCDQTDILSGPIGFKHFYNPDQLLKMADKGWGNTSKGATMSIDELIMLAENVKVHDRTEGKQSRTPGKYIEVYEIHGSLPNSYLDDRESEYQFTQQIQITAFYTDESNQKHGVTLFASEEPELPLKFLSRDKIYGRALGMGGAEELFEPQVWTNYSEIRKKEMLDAASKIIFKTTDAAFAARNKIYNMENLEVAVLAENSDLAQVDTYPRNMQAFENFTEMWQAHAQQMGAANDSIMGENPTAGTPFKLQELVTSESHSLHEYRKGKLARFVDEIYRDWVIPHISREITKGDKFLAELTMDELVSVSDAVVTGKVNNEVKDKIFGGSVITREEVEQLKTTIREDFMRDGNKRFIEILKDEMKDAPMDVYTNIAGKNKNLSMMTDKLVNVFRMIVGNPQVLGNPAMAKLFNQILESSGLSPLDFSSLAETYANQQDAQNAQMEQQQQPQQQSPFLPPQITPNQSVV